jgi:hypothetical protein
MVSGVIDMQRGRGAPAAAEAAATTTSSWATLYRVAAGAAGVAVLLVPIQIVVLVLYPFRDAVAGWFGLLQDNPLAGLVDLDVLLVADNLLLGVIVLAAYVNVRRLNLSVSTLALGMWLFSLVLLIASNPAIGMLTLSGHFAAATSDAERAASLTAGQALLATWQGTGFQVSYIVWFGLIARDFLRLRRSA